MKLMMKVLLGFLAAIALMFFFTRKSMMPRNPPSVAELASGGKRYTGLAKLASLPSQVQESSGIVALPQRPGHYLTHNDSGSKPYLYQINEKGEVEKTIKIPVPNNDWEDITRDDQGNVYIADTGNNKYKREHLVVYKVDPADPEAVQEIRFTYGKAEDEEDKVDAEAIFWYKGSLYLTTKDRDEKKMAKVYRLPDQPGTYEAEPIGRMKLKKKVTGATVSPDGKTVVLLSDGELYVFGKLDDASAFFKHKPETVDLRDAGQTEGVAFKDAHTLVLTSEGGNLYRYNLPE